MKFREFITTSGKKVLCGKDASQNDELVKMYLGKMNKLFHTAEPGSPFCVITELKATKEDINETATFCASKSQDWRDNHSNVEVHIFSGKETYKRKNMKVGTFGVRKYKTIKIKKGNIENLINKTIKTQ